MIFTNETGKIVHAEILGGHPDQIEDLPAGSWLVCPNGHRIAKTKITLVFGGSWIDALSFIADEPKIGTERENCRCPKCGEIWLWPEPTKLND